MPGENLQPEDASKMFQIEDEVLKTLIEKYGEEEQLLQAMGECGELVAVIQNYLRAKKYKHRKEKLTDVLDEAVDVFFMVQQIRHLWPAMFDYICSQKIIKVYQKFEKEIPHEKNSSVSDSSDVFHVPDEFRCGSGKPPEV